MLNANIWYFILRITPNKLEISSNVYNVLCDGWCVSKRSNKYFISVSPPLTRYSANTLSPKRGQWQSTSLMNPIINKYGGDKMTTTVIEFLIEMRMLESQPQLRFPFILNILLLMWTVKKHKCHDDTCYVIRCHGPVSRLVVSCKLVICSCSRHATQRFV